MNALKGIIREVEVSGNLSLVTIAVGECTFKSIVVETPETVDYLTINNAVKVLFKETEVIIGKGADLQISLRNKMYGKIISIDLGSLLASVSIASDAGNIVSIITANAVKQLGLKPGMEVVGMVKTNEVLLAKC
jgi:molybdate transport system regulatory protein